MINIERCSVELARTTDVALAKEAWLFSRPNETNPSIIDIAAIDAPVMEFPRVTVRVRAPILVREVICTLRDHTVWARTSRVDDLSEWNVYQNCLPIEKLKEHMHSMLEAGVHQDTYRLQLPLSYMTSFMVDLPLRTYLKLAAWFNQTGARLDTICGSLFCEMSQLLYAALDPMTRDAIVNADYKVPDICPRPNHYTTSGTYGDFVIINTVVPLALRAQIVRHRLFQIVDDLSTFFSHAGLNSPISSPLTMSLCLSRETAESIVRKRQCWIAQTDLWGSLVAEMNLALGYSEDRLALPCEDGKCPYSRDNDLRKEGRDPGPPCPRYANLHHELLLPTVAGQAREYAEARPNPAYWLQQIGDAS